MTSTLISTAALIGLVVAGSAQAQAVRTERTLSLQLAQQLARAVDHGRGDVVAHGRAGGHRVGGQLRALQRADGAGAHTLGAAQAKAFTSASARNNTLAMMEAAQKNPAAANLVHIPGFLLLGGGVPVRLGNEVIGAVGVGGAPGGHLDEQCAVAALDKAKELLK